MSSATKRKHPNAVQDRANGNQQHRQLVVDIGDKKAIASATAALSFKRPKQADVQIGWIRRSVAYPESMFFIVQEQLSFLRRELAGDLLQKRILDILDEHLSWAKRSGRSMVAFVVFWWLYASFDSFRQLVHEVEMRSNPRVKDTTLLKIFKFTLDRVSSLKSIAFEKQNVTVIFAQFHAYMNLGVNVRHPAILEKRPFDPELVVVDKKTLVPVDPITLASGPDRQVIARVLQDVERQQASDRKGEEEEENATQRR